MPIGTPSLLGNADNHGHLNSLGIPSITITGGDLVVVVVGLKNQASGKLVGSVSDGAGNTYQQAIAFQGTAGNVQFWYSENSTALINGTVTVQLNGFLGTADALLAVVAQCSGILLSGSIDNGATTTIGQNGTNFALDSGAFFSASEISFGVDINISANPTYTQTGVFSNLFNGSDVSGRLALTLCYDIISSQSSVSCSGSWGTSAEIDTAVASFQGSSIQIPWTPQQQLAPIQAQ